MRKKFEKNILITNENIDEIINKIKKKSGPQQKKILTSLQGGRDPITKEKMLDEDGKSTAKKIKNKPMVIDSRNMALSKKFLDKKLEDIQKKHIIQIDKISRGDENED